MSTISLVQIIPSLNSSSQDWVTFYTEAKKQLGTNAANVLFGMAWQKWGASVSGSKADVVTVSNQTGLTLDEGFFDSIRQTGSNAVGVIDGAFSTFSSTGKIVLYSAVGIGVLLIGGIAYRIVTASAQEIGTVAATAAKVAV